jgi:hypothetical protein
VVGILDWLQRIWPVRLCPLASVRQRSESRLEVDSQSHGPLRRTRSGSRGLDAAGLRDIHETCRRHRCGHGHCGG